MKPRTRLLIRFTHEDDSSKSWGYDYPYYQTEDKLRTAILSDFVEFPEHVACDLFYDIYDKQIEADNAADLADICITWLREHGASI